MPDTLGDRMKEYENISRIYLPRRLPVIIRIDGRAFHTFTRGFDRPFDSMLQKTMQFTTKAVCREVDGVKFAYTQSDEISLLLTNDDTLETQPWFGNNIQKLVSISASIATLAFNKEFVRAITREPHYHFDAYINAYDKGAKFDARAFVLPPHEVINYFIWRQQDAVRNSVEMAARSVFSHKQLNGINTAKMKEMLLEKGIDWNNYPSPSRRGACCIKQPDSGWAVDCDIPLFVDDRAYVESRFIRGEANDG